MCIFFGQLVQDCSHSECQIVDTIKALNQKTKFVQKQPKSCQPQHQMRSGVSLSHELPFSQPCHLGFKIQEEEQQEGLYRYPRSQNEEDLARIQALEREVKELRQMTEWMKNQLERKGILP